MPDGLLVWKLVNDGRDGPPRPLGEVYDILAQIGHGTYGTVHRAVCRADGGLVAIKSFRKTAMARRPAGLAAGGSVANVAARATMDALAEVALLDALRHPNIVELLHTVHDEAGVHAALVLWPGDLKGFLARGLDFDRREVARPLLEGVAFLHSREVVHNDLKPSNVLVDDSASPLKLCLADLGQAFWARPGMCRRASTADILGSGLEQGTLPYRAPGPFSARSGLLRAGRGPRWRPGKRQGQKAPPVGGRVARVGGWSRSQGPGPQRPRPEILLGDREHGLPADVWAVGCILGEAALRAPLFQVAGSAGRSQVPYLHLILRRLGAHRLTANRKHTRPRRGPAVAVPGAIPNRRKRPMVADGRDGGGHVAVLVGLVGHAPGRTPIVFLKKDRTDHEPPGVTDREPVRRSRTDCGGAARPGETPSPSVGPTAPTAEVPRDNDELQRLPLYGQHFPAFPGEPQFWDPLLPGLGMDGVARDFGPRERPTAGPSPSAVR